MWNVVVDSPLTSNIDRKSFITCCNFKFGDSSIKRETRLKKLRVSQSATVKVWLKKRKSGIEICVNLKKEKCPKFLQRKEGNSIIRWSNWEKRVSKHRKWSDLYQRGLFSNCVMVLIRSYSCYGKTTLRARTYTVARAGVNISVHTVDDAQCTNVRKITCSLGQ